MSASKRIRVASVEGFVDPMRALHVLLRHRPLSIAPCPGLAARRSACCWARRSARRFSSASSRPRSASSSSVLTRPRVPVDMTSGEVQSSMSPGAARWTCCGQCHLRARTPAGARVSALPVVRCRRVAFSGGPWPPGRGFSSITTMVGRRTGGTRPARRTRGSRARSQPGRSRRQSRREAVAVLPTNAKRLPGRNRKPLGCAMARGRIELPTPRFSVVCSTN
jgi:hypothetical protein